MSARDALPGARPLACALQRRARLGAMALAAFGFVVAGCSSDKVSTVEVSTVTVRAPRDTLVTGETARFTAEVRDQDGRAVPTSIGVEWSATPPSVVTVDATGMVTAAGPGSGTVRATAGGVTGSVTIHVDPPPTLAVDPESVVFTTPFGSDLPPDPVEVEVRNAGAGTLGGLVASVAYAAGGATGWLTPSLASTTAPTTLHLVASATGLPAGNHDATVTLSSPAAPNGPLALPVRLRVVADDPLVRATPALAGFSGVSGGERPPEQRIAIDNSGGGTVDDLSVEVVHADGEAWLAATLVSSSLPTELVLVADPGPLPPGSYEARARLHSAQAFNTPVDVVVSFNVEGRADLRVTKLGPDTATAGGRVTYGVQLRNEGPSAAEGVVLVDSLPGEVVLVEPPPGSTVDGTTIRWEVGDLGPGGVRSYSVVVEVPSGQVGTVHNRAIAMSPTADPAPATRRAEVWTQLRRLADLEAVMLPPDSVVAGTGAEWRFIVRNHGPSDAADVRLVALLAAAAEVVTASDSGSVAGRRVVWPAVATLAAGDSIVRTVTAHVSSEHTGLLSDSVEVGSGVEDPDARNNGGTRVTPVLTRADLEASASAPDTATAGTPLTLRLGVHNRGPSDALQVVVQDTLPLGAVFVSASRGGSEDGGVVTWPAVDRLAPGDSLQEEVVVHIPPSMTGTVRHAVAVASLTDDPDPGSATAAATSTLVTFADLAVALRGPAVDTAGTEAQYTVVVHNAGPSDARGLVVTDTLPPEATFVGASGGGSVAAGVVQWPEVALLAAGDSIAWTLDVAWDPAAVGTVGQVAAVTAETVDPTPGDGRVSFATDLVAAADLSVALSGPVADTAGTEASWTVAATNAGPSTATGVEVVDTLPAGLTGVSVSGGGVVDGEVVRWVVGELAPGASTAGYTVTATIPAGATGALTHRAGVTATTVDPEPADNHADFTTTVLAAADLSVATSGPLTASPGDTITFTVSVSNAGPSAATEVVVTDTLPADFALVSVTGGGTHSAGVIQWDVGTLAPGAAVVTFDVVVEVAGAAAGPLTRTVGVASLTPDPDPADNQASHTVTVDPDPAPPGP